MEYELKYYNHSGKITILGSILTIISGLIATFILSLIYSYAISYIPFIYLNFFITLGYGGILGLTLSITAKAGKIRNNKFSLITSIIFGLLAVYMAWVVWIYSLSKGQFLILSPDKILSFMSLIAEKGAWSIVAITPTGMFLEAIWLVEAIMILVACALSSWVIMDSTPFCEKCNSWAENKQTFMPFEAIENPQSLKEELENGNFLAINLLKKQKEDNHKYAMYELTNCSKCTYLTLLTVSNVVQTTDKEGNKSTSNDYIVKNLFIPEVIYNKFIDFENSKVVL